MAHNVYIQGLSGAGFRVPKVGGGYGRPKEKVNVQVDLDDHRTQLLLSSERNFANFIRTSGSGATTATICGLSRRGFRIKRSSDNAYVQVVVGGYLLDGTFSAGSVTVDLTSAGVRRTLYRSKRDWFFASDPTALSVYGIMNKQNGFDLQLGFDATAKLKNVSSTNVSAGDTVTINDQTYRFENAATQTNDVLIGQSILASLQNLVAAVNGTGAAAVSATATLTSDNTNPSNGDTVTIHDKTYRFESSLSQANDVKIGANADATLVSLGKAVNNNGTVGTDYFTGTTPPTNVTANAENATAHTITFVAAAGGAGNAFASTETSSHLSFGGTTFAGGSGGQTQPTNVLADSILTLDGTNEIYQVTFRATVAGTAANSFASTETSSQLYFGATTFGGGAASSGDSDNGVPTKVYRGQSVTVDTTKPFNFQQLRRHYDRWIEA